MVLFFRGIICDSVQIHKISFLQYMFRQKLTSLFRPGFHSAKWASLCLGFLLFWFHADGVAVQNVNGPSSQNEKVVIPFQYVNGFIVVQLTFQNLLPLRFILDTGAENSILFKKEYADLLGLNYVKTIRLMGSDLSREMKALVSNGVSLQLQGLPPSRQNLIVLEEDFVLVEEIVGVPVDGLIGCSFFGGKPLKIDYKKQELTIFTPKAFQKERLKGFQVLPLEVIQRKPYLQAEVRTQQQNSTSVRLLLDTGAALSCLIHSNTDSLLRPTGKLLPGNLGKGLGGDIEGYTGILWELKMGDLVYQNLIASFQNLDSAAIRSDRLTRNGLLGNLLMERFTLIFDWNGGRLFMRPEKKYNRPFEFDKSGLTIFAFGPKLNRFSVRHILPGSPAEIAGLQAGDEIIKVGRWPVFWTTLARLNKKLASKEGKKISLTWLRNGEEMTSALILRNLFDTPQILPRTLKK